LIPVLLPRDLWILFEIDRKERCVRWFDVLAVDEAAGAATASQLLSLLPSLYELQPGWLTVSEEIKRRSIAQDREHDSGVWTCMTIWHLLHARALPGSVFVSPLTRRSLLCLAATQPPQWVPTMLVQPEKGCMPTSEQLTYSKLSMPVTDAAPTMMTARDVVAVRDAAHASTTSVNSTAMPVSTDSPLIIYVPNDMPNDASNVQRRRRKRGALDSGTLHEKRARKQVRRFDPMDERHDDDFNSTEIPRVDIPNVHDAALSTVPQSNDITILTTATMIGATVTTTPTPTGDQSVLAPTPVECLSQSAALSRSVQASTVKTQLIVLGKRAVV
jgi:hypothetical protein